MYIRTIEEALDALGEVLGVSGHRQQLIESTVRLMLCLDPASRDLLLDGQSFLVNGGLERLKLRRRAWLRSPDACPLRLIEAGEREAFECLAADNDALRFADLVRCLFPALRMDRWKVARAIARDEASVREVVMEGLRARRDEARLSRSLEILRSLVHSHTPAWIDRAGALWAACHQGLRTFPQPPDPDQFDPEVERLFEFTAVSDSRTGDLLAAMEQNSSESARWVHHLEELALELRSLPPEPPQSPEGGSARRSA